jgi:hypothetical protein
MNNKQKILLPDVFIKTLINTPESGMGFHKVDVYLKNGEILKNQIVFNSSILSIDSIIEISIEDIDKIEVLIF